MTLWHINNFLLENIVNFEALIFITYSLSTKLRRYRDGIWAGRPAFVSWRWQDFSLLRSVQMGLTEPPIQRGTMGPFTGSKAARA
jgi:hypothetical protein